MQYLTSKNTYFAAANGYTGFRSYFDELFCSEKYERIFVLKGGPGTGKSSFLKKLHAAADTAGLRCEAILCSSDPNSYDGLILGKGEKEIALLDGTAPHERDAVIPGAIDEILNLGEHWDDSALSRRRGEILTLTKKKKRAYKKAYEFLALSSVFDTKIKAEYDTEKNRSTIREACDSLFEKVSGMARGEYKTRLITSFSRYGEITLEGLFHEAKDVIHLVGDSTPTRLVITRLIGLCLEAGIEMVRFPTVLDGELYEAVYFPRTRTLIHATANSTNEHEVIPLTASASDEQTVRRLEEYREELLAFSAEYFDEASRAHFALEEIYTGAMRFEKIDELFCELKERILSLL